MCQGKRSSGTDWLKTVYTALAGVILIAAALLLRRREKKQ
jgi:MYXO-CTERM domain-containing protein